YRFSCCRDEPRADLYHDLHSGRSPRPALAGCDHGPVRFARFERALCSAIQPRRSMAGGTKDVARSRIRRLEGDEAVDGFQSESAFAGTNSCSLSGFFEQQGDTKRHAASSNVGRVELQLASTE